MKGKPMLARMLAGPLVAALVAAAAAAQEKVEFFDVPDGAHPHDVSPAPDGKVWYTAQRQARSASSIPRPARSSRWRWARARRRTA